MSEDKAMGISRAKTLEWNLNTIIQLVTLVGVCVGGVVIWVDKSRDIEDLQAWRAAHEQYHKERLAEVKASEARVYERIGSIEKDVRANSAKNEQQDYQLATLNQANASATTTMKEVQNALSQQAGDIRVVKEILQRIEAAQRNGR